MAAKSTPFSISTATMTIDGDTYCASDVSLTYNTEALTFQCMSSANPATFAGLETWSGTATLAYDVLGMDDLWGNTGILSFVITKSTGGTITLASTTGVVITDVSSTFSNSELPQVAISFVGNGALTEVIA